MFLAPSLMQIPPRLASQQADCRFIAALQHYNRPMQTRLEDGIHSPRRRFTPKWIFRQKMGQRVSWCAAWRCG